MSIRCICIDDEPLAVKQIVSYIQRIPYLELAGEGRSAAEAMSLLDAGDIDLMFIDISMPDISGMELVKSLVRKPHVVFTTAFSEFAVEGFEVNAVDYLVKPISFDNFLRAAGKVKSLIELSSRQAKENNGFSSGHLFVKSAYKLVRIELNEIKYIESQHEYVLIHLKNSPPVLTQVSLKSMEEQLPAKLFMRVHRSFIVNLEMVTLVDRNRIVFDEKTFIPVGNQYKESFQHFIDRNFV